jgi:hypothetical protein
MRLGRVERAIDAYKIGEVRNPGYSLNLVTLAAAQAVAGRTRDARETLLRLRTIAPDYSLEDYDGLARRMTYWFGENPTREEILSAMTEVWRGLPAG